MPAESMLSPASHSKLLIHQPRGKAFVILHAHLKMSSATFIFKRSSFILSGCLYTTALALFLWETWPVGAAEPSQEVSLVKQLVGFELHSPLRTFMQVEMKAWPASQPVRQSVGQSDFRRFCRVQSGSRGNLINLRCWPDDQSGATLSHIQRTWGLCVFSLMWLPATLIPPGSKSKSETYTNPLLM